MGQGTERHRRNASNNCLRKSTGCLPMAVQALTSVICHLLYQPYERDPLIPI